MNEKHQQPEASFCSTIPLHQTNSIQPQGILLVADLNNFHIIQASENVNELFDVNIDEVLNQPLQKLISVDSFSRILENLGNYHHSLPCNLEIVLATGLISVDSVIHEKNGCLLLEIELPKYNSTGKDSFNNFFQQVQHIMSSINNCNSVTEVANVAARQVKQLSGFDKVMIYSFDEEWIGTVIAEEMEEGMDSYLGLRFPSSDIPRQARDLYLKNPYRLIPNRDYKAVSLFPALNPITRQPTDLSDCKFRSVLAVHLEYLKNMNVVTSMSTRIIHKEQLWGLIACHHRTAKYLSFQECSFFEFLSNIISSKIGSLLYKHSSTKEQKLKAQYDNIIQHVYSLDNTIEGLESIKDELLMLFHADGICVTRDGEISLFGITPSLKQVRDLLPWLQEQGYTKTEQIIDLPLRYDAATQFADTGTGLLLLPIQPYEGNYIMAFRTELIRKVSWGGNPNEALTFEPNSRKYHPRNSFAIWKETVRFTAESWSKEELDIAEKLRVAIVELTLRKFTATLEQQVFKRTEELETSKASLEATNSELMQILYVTSHDLSEPVRKMQVYGSMLDGNVTDEKAAENLERLQASGKRVSTLLNSILNYSRLSQKGHKSTTDLNEIVKEVLVDLEMMIKEKKAVIQVSRLPKITAVPDQMRQVFQILIDNALKFSSEKDVQISIFSERMIGLERSEDVYCISVKDNGIGFNQEYSDYIFNMFRKFHNQYFEGAGIGLTIARKIVENHNGTLTAKSEENKGAEFIITLPVE